MSFFNELKRRNVFKVAAAYIIVGWLVMQVGDTLAPALHLPEWINSALAFFLILGFPLALFFAWAFEMTPEGIKKEKEVDRSESITHVTSQKLNNLIIGLLVLALGYFAFDKFVLDPERDAELVSTAQQQAVETAVEAEAEEQGPDENSIAVLPFVNMSDDAANEYFSDGITEELLNLLAKIPELRVTSRSSAFSFKGQNVDIPTVADKLNVAHVLEGSVRKAGNRVRITAQLIEAGSDVHMWSETYDRELNDVFAIQDEIAREVVTVLELQLLGAVPEAVETDSEAYTAYLQGRYFLETTNFADSEPALEAFQRAIDIDPEYAPAWAGLGRVLRARANWGLIDLHEGTESARQAVTRALELDDSLAEAWGALAHIQFVYDWDWYTAQGTTRTALMHGPNDAAVLVDASRIMRALGRFDESILYARRAVDMDPLNGASLRNLGQAYGAGGMHAESEAVFRRSTELYPTRLGPRFDLVYALLNLGRAEEALALALVRAVQTTESEPGQVADPEQGRIFYISLANSFIFHQLGQPEEAERNLQVIVDRASDWLAYQVAEAYAFSGQADLAFEWLEISYQQKDGGVTHLLGDFAMKNLHNDPRWEPYLLKLGLLEAWKNNARPHWEQRQ
jgi:TolB-like protein/Tfp pilus assembly protein PilF